MTTPTTATEHQHLPRAHPVRLPLSCFELKVRLRAGVLTAAEDALERDERPGHDHFYIDKMPWHNHSDMHKVCSDQWIR